MQDSQFQTVNKFSAKQEWVFKITIKRLQIQVHVTTGKQDM